MDSYLIILYIIQPSSFKYVSEFENWIVTGFVDFII